ncbi:MAG: flagellar hook-basal body complex protein FliE [Campylobacter sp.]|jgi:flagellar hook-basal body complex protein fliE|uniref:flagellar hook-basal body complex protein FliE n=1 Tax=uncultured Campylobacter sp. TaxID=218934 RepID=UPI0025F61D1B|nr:flagellar hook-basal body complex protein FliE [uncultured Campylobacter sp.]
MINDVNLVQSVNKAQNLQKASGAAQSDGFADMLNESLKELNKVQVNADKAIADLATGEVKDLHQAAIAIGKAETSMKLMLEIRNKALSAYKEISRTQI